MTLDILTKQCVIIGSFAAALSLVLILQESINLWIILSREGMEESHRTKYINRNILNFTIYGAGAIASILLILGACKRRHLMLIPLLLCVFGATAFTIFFIGFNMVTLPFAHFEFLANFLPIFGLETLLLHILCSTFYHIRREKAEEPNRRIYYDSI
ncbi:uncharacterized protein LOC106093930 [Stomoxys calcitrans]|uniref:uncharacterized protein LOC106093930 n=1 Tax=Stomoxys calcitrans TaxID=35570 RepID=UPI0027E2230A|nr:uncharacterized protein LOC106093930 [Stomoxys calcitrans]